MKKALFYSVILSLVSLKLLSQSYEGLYSEAFRSAGIWNTPPKQYDSICMLLKLPAVNNCKDSFMLRVWLSSMMGYELVTLMQVGNSWESHKYAYYGNINSLKEKVFKPKISIGYLLDSIRTMELKNLKSQLQIEGFIDSVSDGTTYTLEAIYPDSFTVVTYHSPNSFTDMYNMKFARIINLLAKHFNWNWL